MRYDLDCRRKREAMKIKLALRSLDNKEVGEESFEKRYCRYFIKINFLNLVFLYIIEVK